MVMEAEHEFSDQIMGLQRLPFRVLEDLNNSFLAKALA